jgi:ATP-dependent helicase/nuclease subunit A
MVRMMEIMIEIMMVLRLLDNQEILEKYQNKFRYFMIDEFQDTNELQKNIFYKLATIKKPLDRQNLFIVGDPKQSIYGFRGADIDVFYDVIDDINNDSLGDVITLKENYRSFDTILQFINDVFAKIMQDKYSELLFNKISNNDIDIEILHDEVNRCAKESSIYEAQAIAKRIKTLVQVGKYQYKDIALLFRASTRNHIYEEALKDYNIPYYNSSSKRFFNRQEILDIINGLKTISNPYDTIAAIGFLRSPMIGLKDTSIYWLLKYLDTNVYNTILNIKDNSIFSKEEKEKLNEAAEILGYFYKVKNLYCVSEILNLLIEKTLFVETSLLKADGRQILANIYKFIELTNSYSSENNYSLEDYIDYLDKIKASNESEGVIQSEEDDVVKIITIHSAKGLQFPVVIIPEMSRGSGGTPPKMLYSKDIGIGVKTEATEGIYGKIYSTQKTKEKEEAERILYVAVTRAEEMLILGCYGGDYGFKKMIKNLLPKDQIRYIYDIELEKEVNIPVKSIKESLLSISHSETLPTRNSEKLAAKNLTCPGHSGRIEESFIPFIYLFPTFK